MNQIDTPTTHELSSLWTIPQTNCSTEQLSTRRDQLIARLNDIKAQFPIIKFATSLGAEDMVLTDAIFTSGVQINLFTLQTGRLHQETLEMIDRVERHYQKSIERLFPDTQDVEVYIQAYGLNGFYESEAAKKACCDVRKVNLLNTALSSVDAWLTGQRREQAVTRADLPFQECDAQRGVAKFNPLFDWTEDEVWAYLQWRNVPIHPLHLKGYPSIGCEPCTRAIRQGEDVRAGRWWWLQQESKECGLHVK